MKKKKEDLMAVWNQTLEACKDNEYEVSNRKVPLSTVGKTIHYYHPTKLEKPKEKLKTRFRVINMDSLEAAKMLREEDRSNNIAVLNMASKTTPGGGVSKGSFSQEEELFRRTNLSRSLFRFSEFGRSIYNYPEAKKPIDDYPLSLYGGIFSRKVTVFREKDTYDFLEDRDVFTTNIISVAAFNRPELNEEGTRLLKKYAIMTKEKIRVILRIAALENINSLVLGAFGCGAYQNPAKHMAELFRTVFDEPEFLGRFKNVVFAILEDQNSIRENNKTGNFKPFRDEFLDTYGLVYIDDVPTSRWDFTLNRFVDIPENEGFSYAWFSDRPELVWGDDWDDAPYESNAEEPSTSTEYDLERVRFKGSVILKTVDVSMEDFKNGKCNWDVETGETVSEISYGTTLKEFFEIVEV